MEHRNEAILIDGNSLVYRAHFALIRSPLRNSRGENTSAVFGFANSLRKLIARFHPDYMAVVFDAPGRTFRDEKFEEYKMQRPKTPDDLILQLPLIKRLVSAWGIAQFEVPGVEADDVLGTLTRQLGTKQFKVCLVTSDKDLFQLVGSDVLVLDPFKDVVYDPSVVRERFGVPPEQIADLLALSGDSIDNIPGVPGIGEKRAQEILLKHGSLQAAIEHDPRVSRHRADALLSKALTEIRTDLDLAVTVEDLRIRPADHPALVNLFKELEFTSLLKEMAGEESETIAVRDGFKLGEFAGLKLVGLGVSEDICFIAPDREQVFRIEARDPQLQAQILTNQEILKVGHDLKPVLRYFNRSGLKPEPIADTMIAAWLLDPNFKRYDVPELLLRFCDRAISSPDVNAIPAYALELFSKLQPELRRRHLDDLFHNVEMPLEHVLARMELRGVKLDRKLLGTLSQELEREIAGLERKIQSDVGCQFNLNSPQQLSSVLFDRLKLKPKRRTKTGYSTDARVLQELALTSPIVACILHLRELSKLQSTYLEPLTRLSDPKTGRIHTTFNQTATATGRLSASEPNLQNVPIRSELGRRIREAFITDSGFVLISADYSQIELRILAELSGDKNLRAAFERDEDIHTRTACAVLGCTEKEVTPEARRIAKVVNYGLVYGMSDFGLADRLGLGREESQAFIDAYLALYPEVNRWRQDIVKRAEQEGVARTLFGRIRPLPGLQSKNAQVREAAQRAAINTPVQGTAADIIKRAMIAIDDRLRQAGFRGGTTLQIHDELLLEIEQERAAEAEEILLEAMQQTWTLAVPLKVEIGSGPNWAAIH